MNGLLGAGATALWLGILTSISPCPLASNVAALSWLARGAAAPRRVLAAGIAYSLGRAVSYVVVAGLVVASLLSVPGVSFFLQRQMNQLLGPLLVVIGAGLMGWLPIRLNGPAWSDALRARVAGAGWIGAGLLGMLLALSFCPVSAGLFFGGLIPLATGSGSRLVLPALYGIGTGLPVVVAAVVLSSGLQQAGGIFNAMARVERVARPASGVIFLLAGLYLTAVHLFGLNL